MIWRRKYLELTLSCGYRSKEEGIKPELNGSGLGGERVLGSWMEGVVISNYDKMSEEWNE